LPFIPIGQDPAQQAKLGGHHKQNSSKNAAEETKYSSGNFKETQKQE